ncbi:MAG: CocE/NonD family hydrolase [Polyangiales bacterium]
MSSRTPVFVACASLVIAACAEDDVATPSIEAPVAAQEARPENRAPTTYPAEWNTVFAVPGYPLPANYEFGRRTTTLAKGSTFGKQKRALPCDVTWERDIPITLRDGVVIHTDVLLPAGATEKVPALVAWSPYGKTLPTAGPASVPPEWFSGIGKFEGPDAAFWVCNGYAVVNPDARGAYKSQGLMHGFGRVDAGDGYDAIAWIAQQSWSNGNVGMHGASWLAIVEWFIAATNPPALKAIAPWNGQSDLYRNSLILGGIPDTAFSSLVGNTLVCPNGLEDTVSMANRFPLYSDYWNDKRAKVEDIRAAAYVGADIATVLHTAGTLDAYRRLGSKEKWLRVNNTNEWYDQYTPENEKDLLRFFDHYLKGSDNGWEQTPRVRVSPMDPGKGGAEKPNTPYDAWPIPGTKHQKLYLQASGAALSAEAPVAAEAVSYDAVKGATSFTVRFSEDTQIVGHLTARLYLEAQGADDLDVFVLVEKLDADGTPLIPSEIARLYFPVPPPGAPGRQRASLRAVDASKSIEGQPVHAFDTPRKLVPGEVVPVDVAIMPTAMRWHAGQQLKLTVAGAPVKGPNLPLKTLNAGTHVVHTGGERASYLQVPVVPFTP